MKISTLFCNIPSYDVLTILNVMQVFALSQIIFEFRQSSLDSNSRPFISMGFFSTVNPSMYIRESGIPANSFK
jgi:hypothetical protein